jgi:hypothetical protein
MGCWNATDGITGLPIIYPEPVRCFVIASRSPHPYLGGHCHPDDAWYPIAPPIKGTYDDYGRVENIEPGVVADWLEHRLPMTDEMREEISGHDHSIESELERKLLAVERAVSFIDDCWQKNVRLCLWMVAEKTWHTMFTVDYECWSERPKARAANLIETFNGLDGENEIVDDMKLRTGETELIYMNPMVSESLRWAQANNRYVEMVEAVAELEEFKWAMGATRRHYTPMTGCGGQDADWAAHKLIAQLIMDRVEQGDEE